MKKFIFIIILLIISIVLYARYIAIYKFEVKEFTIGNKDIPSSFDGISIVHFSDLLYNDYTQDTLLENLVKEINNLKPDIVFFTGDLIDDSYKISDKEKENIINALKSIDTTLYKFASFGDNDLKIVDTYKTILDSSDFLLLDNESYPLFYEGNEPIIITGITDINSLTESYLKDESINANYNITLIHKPDLVDSINNGVDLFLSGHSLGGFINPPFLNPLITKDNASKYFNGYYKVNSADLYVSNGIGIEDYPFRFSNTPSINYYLLKETE